MHDEKKGRKRNEATPTHTRDWSDEHDFIQMANSTIHAQKKYVAGSCVSKKNFLPPRRTKILGYFCINKIIAAGNAYMWFVRCGRFITHLLKWFCSLCRMNKCYYIRVYVEKLVNANLININCGSFSSRATFTNNEATKKNHTRARFPSIYRRWRVVCGGDGDGWKESLSV